MRDSLLRYRILKELDATDLLSVYLAEDPSQRKLIVRLFDDAAPQDPEAFLQTTREWAELDHPGITPVLDTGEVDGHVFVVTAFVEGTPLRELVRRAPLRPVDTHGLMHDLASALAYLHRRGIVHGHLHPARLIVDRGGRIKIVDLHVGRFVRPPQPNDANLVDPDAVRYVSPESVAGAAIDSRSDIFAFGAIFYEVLTGRPAFPGSDVAQVLGGIRSAPPDLPHASSWPHATLAGLIEQCLQRDPGRRYQDLDKVLNQLEATRQKFDQMGALAARVKEQLTNDEYASAVANLEFASLNDACEDALRLDPDNMSARALLERARAAAATAHKSGGPGATEEPVRTLDENVQFTVYRPSVVAPGRWYPMLAFAHLASPRPDAPADEPDPVAEVQRQAKQVLGEHTEDFQPVAQDSMRPIPERGHLRFVPSVDGVEFNPLERSFRWTESVHREEFRLNASQALDGGFARGVVDVYLGHLLVAEITVAIRIDSRPVAGEPIADDARPYRRIFASYSHRDTAIVEELEDHVQSLGDEYLRDVTQLRSGEVWSPRLAEMIASADVFQLFWSWNALKSPFVRAEWEHALGLRRGHFIRPVYWEDPFPSTTDLPPSPLRELHFKQIHPRSVVPVRNLPSSNDLELSAPLDWQLQPPGMSPAPARDPFAPRRIAPSSPEFPAEEIEGPPLAPLELLNLVPKSAPVQKAPIANDLERGSPLDAHYEPPAVVPAPAAESPPNAMTIPSDYDPLAPDDAPFVPPSSPAERPPDRRVAYRPHEETVTAPPAADFAAVLGGAGLDPANVTNEIARDVGQILLVVVSGVMDIMRLCQQFKDEFRMRTTRVRPAKTNPLEFSANVDDALHNLLVKRNPAHLSAVEAFEDAFADLRNHQIAMLAGMQVAFESMLAEFDPDRLQQEFDRKLNKGLVPPTLRYWGLYRERCREIVKDPDASFRRLFGEEFARAYEMQLGQLKAKGRP